MTDPLIDPLVEAIEYAEARTKNQYDPTDCQACQAIEAAPTAERQDALQRALAGTIGQDKLVEILRVQGITVGRRHLRRHRHEKHGV